MAILSAELVQRLARHRGNGSPVISLYLNVDGKQRPRPEDYRAPLEAMIKEALAKHDDKRVADDLAKIRTEVGHELDRGRTRGLAIFSAGDSLWEVVAIPVPVEDHLAVNLAPHLRQLDAVLDGHNTIGVLMTDKQRARLLVIEMGHVVEREEIVDPLPRHDDDKGDWGKDHVKTHSGVAAQHHLKNAATAMFDLYQRHHFTRLLLCVSEEMKPELERQLHAYLRVKVVGRSNLPINSPDEEVVSVASDFAKKAGRAEETIQVDKLRAGVASNAAAGRTNGNSTGAVAGLDSTLKAVFEKRVETLLVSEGFVTEGWRCVSCSYIATVGRKCRMCGAEMTLVDDVVEEAVEDALGQKCKVEFCSENADLDVLGRIGALLRF